MMTAHTVAEAFAAAAARLTGREDVAGSLIALLRDCAAVMEVDAAGLLVRMPDEGLALLSSTTHTATMLELYELQNGHGPCIEAVERNVVIRASSIELGERWPSVGSAVLAAGYQTVYAFPLRWHAHAVGALNLYARAGSRPDPEHEQLGQAFANMAVAIVALPVNTGWTEVHTRIVHVLSERVDIERAKGVLAVQNDIDLDQAFDLLIARAAGQNQPLADYAAEVLGSVRKRETRDPR